MVGTRLAVWLAAALVLGVGCSGAASGGARGDLTSGGASVVVQQTSPDPAVTDLVLTLRNDAGQEVQAPERQPAGRSVRFQGLPSTAATLQLDYMQNGRRLARFALPLTGQEGPELVLSDPPAVSESDPVRFSFAFLGCNRVNNGDVTGVNSPSSANVGQLQQDFTEIPLLQPTPSYVFFCGDLVLNEAAGTQTLTEQLQGWKAFFATTPLAASAVKLVPLVGNHEMVQKTGAGEIPNPPTGPVWTSEMAPWIYGSDGPTMAPPNPDGVQRDESRLSYSFRDGSRVFVVVNTDTFVGGDQPGDSGHVPLHWLQAILAAAQADATVTDVYVFGHRPVQSPDPDNPGIVDSEAWQFYALLAASPKVRGYFCAHAHLWQQGVPSGAPSGSTLQEVISGNGGSKAEKTFVKHNGFYGYTVVGSTQSGATVLQAFGRAIPATYDAPPPQPPSTLRAMNVLTR